jgi:iron complex transport system permease protein
MITGPDHRKMIPVCALLGAFYLVVCDGIARNLAQAEIPIGIITSIVGAPYLFFLVRTRGQRAFGG